MKHKVLTVKEYIKVKAHEGLDERLTEAFAKYIQEKKIVRLQYNAGERGSSCVKLRVKFELTHDFPSSELILSIYLELFEMCLSNLNIQKIIVNKLFVTPEIIDVSNPNNRYRGVIASFKQVV